MDHSRLQLMWNKDEVQLKKNFKFIDACISNSHMTEAPKKK